MQNYTAWQLLANQPLAELQLKGLGPKRLEKLASAGIHTALDLLAHLPRAYRDYSKETPVGKLQADMDVAVCGRLLSLHSGRTARKRIPILEGLIDDGTGTVRVVWYRQAYLKNKLNQQATYRVWGQTRRDKVGLTLANPKIQVNEELETVIPIEVVYPLAGGLPSSLLGPWIAQLLDRLPATPHIPEELAQSMSGADFLEALETLHRPGSIDPGTGKPHGFEHGIKGLKILEFLVFQIQMRRLVTASQNRSHPRVQVPWETMQPFFATLPFKPTGDQHRVIQNIWESLGAEERLLALVQGDVGSGKTLVALSAAFLFVRTGHQVAMMVPTTLLAGQHYRTACQFLAGVGIRVGLLSGNAEPSENRRTLLALEAGQIDFVIGTHMLFQGSVRFSKLGLVMIDEQHRFGVGQRSALLKKGDAPHYLAFSATPIPRSLALTLYGDFQVYQIKEKPAKRKAVSTILKHQSNRDEVLDFAKKRIACGEGVFWVLPTIEGESLAHADSAVAMQKHLRKSGIDSKRLGLVHGAMEKAVVAKAMAEFREGKLDILVATTVVEVGVDVPRASVMVIDGAQQFGLSQLHQLRGRVGRDQNQAFCFLMVPEALPVDALKRMRLLEQTEDGFQIAEADLANRGAGHLLGKKQSGQPIFHFGDPWHDKDLMVAVSDWLAKEGRRGAIKW